MLDNNFLTLKWLKSIFIQISVLLTVEEEDMNMKFVV